MDSLRIARHVLWLAAAVTVCYGLLPAPAPSDAWLSYPRRPQPAPATPDCPAPDHFPVSR